MSIGWIVFGLIVAIGLVAVFGFAPVKTVRRRPSRVQQRPMGPFRAPEVDHHHVGFREPVVGPWTLSDGRRGRTAGAGGC